jgi:hypothetical protein
MMGSNQMRAASIVPSFNGRPRCEPLSYGPIGRRWLTMQSTTNLFDEDRTDVTSSSARHSRDSIASAIARSSVDQQTLVGYWRAIKWSSENAPGPRAITTRKQVAHTPCVGQAPG